jgi:hypothetical protein
VAERRTIPVHAFDDERVHLAVAHLGRLQQGRLETLCGRLAVTQLSPFAVAAGKAADRCRVCFRKVDEDGLLRAELVAKKAPAKAKPTAEIIDLAGKRKPKAAPPVVATGAGDEGSEPAASSLQPAPTSTARAKASGAPKARPTAKAKPTEVAKAKPTAKAKPGRGQKPPKPKQKKPRG